MDQEQRLMDAVCSGKIDDVRKALTANVDINVNDGIILQMAVLWGHTEIVKLLIEHGADVHAHKHAALRCARAYKRQHLIDILEAAAVAQKSVTPAAIEQPASNLDMQIAHLRQAKAKGAKFARPPELDDELGRTSPARGRS